MPVQRGPQGVSIGGGEGSWGTCRVLPRPRKTIVVIDGQQPPAVVVIPTQRCRACRRASTSSGSAPPTTLRMTSGERAIAAPPAPPSAQRDRQPQGTGMAAAGRRQPAPLRGRSASGMRALRRSRSPLQLAVEHEVPARASARPHRSQLRRLQQSSADSGSTDVPAVQHREPLPQASAQPGAGHWPDNGRLRVEMRRAPGRAAGGCFTSRCTAQAASSTHASLARLQPASALPGDLDQRPRRRAYILSTQAAGRGRPRTITCTRGQLPRPCASTTCCNTRASRQRRRRRGWRRPYRKALLCHSTAATPPSSSTSNAGDHDTGSPLAVAALAANVKWPRKSGCPGLGRFRGKTAATTGGLDDGIESLLADADLSAATGPSRDQ